MTNSPRPSDTTTGWLFVAGQAVLLGLLIVLPSRTDWPDWSNSSFITSLARACFWLGLALTAVAALNLGRALTPTPVPKDTGTLRTDGLYRFVRHPIYSGVLLVVVGMTVGSSSWPKLFTAAITFAFFNVKARWEERRLAQRFADYPAYCASTPRFVPRPRFRS